MQGIAFLNDGKRKRKKSPWQTHKYDSVLLSESYSRIGEVGKSCRVANCADCVEFKRFIDGTCKLNYVNFCQVRLCPMCAWRRTLKVFGQVSQVMDYISDKHNYSYLFLSLTIRNVPGDELMGAFDDLLKSFKMMMRRKEMTRVVKGWFRCLEVTHKWERGDDYHPHIHVILVVDDKYFRSKDYISHSELMKLWRDCAGLDYDPWVRIQAVKPKPGGEGDMDYGKAVAEVAKYTVKAADFIVRPPEEKSKYYERAKRYAEEQTDEAVMILDKALTRRRLVAFGGVMKEVHKLLSLEDPESGDLINTDNEKRIRDDLFYVIERYRWSPGYRNYVLEAVEDQGGNDITEVANPFEEGA